MPRYVPQPRPRKYGDSTVLLNCRPEQRDGGWVVRDLRTGGLVGPDGDPTVCDTYADAIAFADHYLRLTEAAATARMLLDEPSDADDAPPAGSRGRQP